MVSRSWCQISRGRPWLSKPSSKGRQTSSVTISRRFPACIRRPGPGLPDTPLDRLVFPLGDAPSGRLADLAPTLLALMGLEQPEEMTGTSLLK